MKNLLLQRYCNSMVREFGVNIFFKYKRKMPVVDRICRVLIYYETKPKLMPLNQFLTNMSNPKEVRLNVRA